jgi:2,3-bisphosphoglycerate-independent phosphoglycerate mutase
VLVEGKQTSNPVIDFGEVYFDNNYQDRYIVIVNDHHTPLDMLV